MFRSRATRGILGGRAAVVTALLAQFVAAPARSEELSGRYSRIPVATFAGGGTSGAAPGVVGTTLGQPGPVGRMTNAGGTTVLDAGFWAAATTVASSPVCPGDCNRDDEVTVEEIVRGVGIALGTAALDTCPVFDGNGDAEVTIEELIVAVNIALNGCGSLSR